MVNRGNSREQIFRTRRLASHGLKDTWRPCFFVTIEHVCRCHCLGRRGTCNRASRNVGNIVSLSMPAKYYIRPTYVICFGHAA